MPFWLVPLSFAGEPVASGGPTVRSPDSSVAQPEVVIGWDDVSFQPAAPESPAIGPDFLALGNGGTLAVYDPLAHQVWVVGHGGFGVPRADGLAIAGSVVLVLDESARTLRSYSLDGAALSSAHVPGLVPQGGELYVSGSLVLSRDLFGNGHPVATVSANGALSEPTGPALFPVPHRVLKKNGYLEVDGRNVGRVRGEGKFGARVVGEWLIVDALEDRVSDDYPIPRLAARSLTSGREVPLPGGAWSWYRPAQYVTTAPDGTLAYMYGAADGLHIARVSP